MTNQKGVVWSLAILCEQKAIRYLWRGVIRPRRNTLKWNWKERMMSNEFEKAMLNTLQKAVAHEFVKGVPIVEKFQSSNMPGHSPEPWRLEDDSLILQILCAEGYPVLVGHGKPGAEYWPRNNEASANIHHAFACVKACRGLN